jgi:hypothetical protein
VHASVQKLSKKRGNAEGILKTQSSLFKLLNSNKKGRLTKQAGWDKDAPALTANIFAAATNRTTRQNKADWLGL